MSNIPFVHLHGHSAYSLLDGLTKVPDLVEKAAVLGMPAIAITDHGVMWACANLFTECMQYIEMKDTDFALFNKAREEAGKRPFKSRPKPILGYEAYYASGMRYPASAGNTVSKHNYHMVLFARNIEGWHNLSLLHYHGFKDGFYRKPRVDMTLLKQHGAGITALSGCLGGYPQQELLSWKATNDNDHYHKAIKHIEMMLKAMDGHYYLEVQDTGIERIEREGIYIPEPQRWLADQFYKLGEKYDIPVVLTNDFHYLNEDDKKAHAATCRIGHFIREDGSLYDQNWMKTSGEMAKLFPEYPEWMENTVKVANDVELFDIRLGDDVMPKCELPSGFDNEEAYLRFLTWEGFENRYPEDHTLRAEAKDRLVYELAMISKMGFPGYFIIVRDIYREARVRGITYGLGRGSAAGCCVSYCLKITGIDPLEYGLLFERFLNPGRSGAPDIDMDFGAKRRGELIEYIKEKYGEGNVSHIITFNSLKSRQVLRDLGRVHGIDYLETDRLAKAIPVKFGQPMELEKAFQEVEFLKEELANSSQVELIYNEALKIEGNPKAQSIHAAGLIIAPEKVYKYIPTGWDRKKQLMVTAFEGSKCEEIGLMKMDMLGLRTLDIYDAAKKDIKKHYDIDIIDDDIPFDDSRTWEVFRRGMTRGVFQMEAGGFQEFCRHMEPDDLIDVIAMVALYRPGPLESDMHKKYKARKDGHEEVTYFPGCEKYLDKTYGLMIYQEQVMQITQHLCGFSLSDADKLRKAIGKKNMELLKKQELSWKAGATKVGLINETQADKLWVEILAFANYAFNLSHAACYGIFAYWTAYLKANFPSYYIKAMLNDRSDDTERLAMYVNEVTDVGLRILPPDINESKDTFEVQDNAILFGLIAVKGMGASSARAIVSARNRHGKFTSIQDFCNKVNTTQVNRGAIVALIKAGAFSKLYPKKAAPLAMIEVVSSKSPPQWSIIRQGHKKLDPLEIGKQYKKIVREGAFSDLIEENNDPDVEYRSLTERDELDLEFEALGFFLTDSPLKFHKKMLELYFRRKQVRHVSEARDIVEGNPYCLYVGVVSELVAKIAKSRAPYWLFKLQEDVGIDAIAFETAKDYMKDIKSGDVVLIQGKTELKTEDNIETLQVIAYAIEKVIDEDTIIRYVEIAERREDERRKRDKKYVRKSRRASTYTR